MDAFGGLASVAQMLAYAISISSGISDIRARIRGRTDRLRQYEHQIKELEVVTALVHRNKALQDTEIKTCLRAIMDNIEKAKKILTKFQQSHRARQLWAIMDGSLTRKLELPFMDAQKSMEHLSVMVVSENAKEIQAVRLGMESHIISSPQATFSSQHIDSMESSNRPSRPLHKGPQVRQTGSTFRSKIRLSAKGASANQGNKMWRITEGDIMQEGSTFEGEIEVAEGAELKQGNEIDGQGVENTAGDEDVMDLREG